VLHIFIQDLRPTLLASSSNSMQSLRRKGEKRLCQLYDLLEKQVWAAYRSSSVVMQYAYDTYASKRNWGFDTAFLDEKYFRRVIGRGTLTSDHLQQVVQILRVAEQCFDWDKAFLPTEVVSSRAAEYKRSDLFPTSEDVKSRGDKKTAEMWTQIANLPEVIGLPQRGKELPNFDKYRIAERTAQEADGDGGDDMTLYLDPERRLTERDIIEHWGSLAIDAITVQPSSADHVTVAIPFAVGLQMFPEDLNFVIRLMAVLATESLRSLSIGDSTTVQLEVVRHKKKEFEIDGERFCYQQCLSDRPGYNITLNEEQRPVVHAYCAMGLEHQHEQQQVVLARCTSYVAAAVWVHACMTLFPKKLTRYMLGDCAADCSDLWEKACADAGLEAKVLRKEWKTFDYESWMEDAIQAHKDETPWELFDAKGLCTRFDYFTYLTREQPTSMEPVVSFSHNSWYSRVAPREILAPSGGSRPWRGHLHLCGVDHILDRAWMTWRRPNLVVNFVDLRIFFDEHAHVKEIRAFQKKTEHRCLNLAWSNGSHRLEAVITLRTVAKILETDETQHVIFHCRNGKHRAAFGILALLQLHYKMSYEDAMDALGAGTANHGGWPPVELDKVKPFLWEWLEKELQP
jgi:hypothetical protein